MTEQMRAFVEYYLVCQNATRAAIQAGYSKHTAHITGSKLLRKPSVNQALMQEYASRTERTHIDQDYVMARAVDLVERCMEGQPVLDKKGNPVTQYVEYGEGETELVCVWQFNPRAAADALKILAKHLGMDQQTVNHNVSGTVTHQVELSPALSELLDQAYKDGKECQQKQQPQFCLQQESLQ